MVIATIISNGYISVTILWLYGRVIMIRGRQRRMLALTARQADTLSLEAQTFLEHTGVPRLNKPCTAAMLRQAIQRF